MRTIINVGNSWNDCYPTPYNERPKNSLYERALRFSVFNLEL